MQTVKNILRLYANYACVSYLVIICDNKSRGIWQKVEKYGFAITYYQSIVNGYSEV